MKNLALLPALALAFTACADQPDPLAPGPAFNHGSQHVYFTSTPPAPAYVGDTYNVTAESLYGFGFIIRTDTPDICSLPETHNNSPVTATFRAAGSCELIAECSNWSYWECYDSAFIDSQTLEVVEPLVTLPPNARVPAERRR
jgi:hypothetical protein